MAGNCVLEKQQAGGIKAWRALATSELCICFLELLGRVRTTEAVKGKGPLSAAVAEEIRSHPLHWVLPLQGSLQLRGQRYVASRPQEHHRRPHVLYDPEKLVRLHLCELKLI